MATKDPKIDSQLVKSCIVSALSIRTYILFEAIERWRYMSIRILIYFLRLDYDESR